VIDPDYVGVKAPLELVLCEQKSGGCGLLQLRHTLDLDVLYSNYWYRSGVSTTMVKALENIVNSAQKLIPLSAGDIVIDIGSNDGTLLRQYKTPDIITIGFEPSNLWESGIPGTTKIYQNYFTAKPYEKDFGDKKSKIITSIAMFYDLEYPNTFVKDVKNCLHRDGLWIIQVNYLGLMLENNTFDNISHEHLEYYSLLSIENILKRHDMETIDIELNTVNGGSFRLYVKHKNGSVKPFADAEERLRRQRAYEEKMQFGDREVYNVFATRIKSLKNELKSFLQKENEKGKSIFIYGASTRGLIVLHHFEISNELIDAATDKNSQKWGKYIIGTGIPILSIEEYRKRKPDYLLVLPYHFLEEIQNQEKIFLEKGGKMIVPLPELRVVGKDDLQ
jgi:hypothetical protein